MEEGSSPRLRTEPLARAELVHLRWAVPPLLVLIAGNLFFDLAGAGYGRVGAQLLADHAGGDAPLRGAVLAAAAITWATAALAFILLGAGALVASWRLVNERVQGRARRPFLLFAAGASLLGFANLVLADLADLPLEAIYRVTLDALRAEPMLDGGRVAIAGAVVAGINVMAVVVPAMLLAAGAASALPPRAGWNDRTLARRALQVREVVGVTAAFLVAGVLHMGAWTHLAGATLSAEADATLDLVAAPVTLFWGTTFTLMTAAFYLPLAVRLARLAEAVMDEDGVAPADRPRWLEARGLSFRFGQQVPQIAAMAAPLLAGPVGGAVTHAAEFLAF